jgi:hypothetical protein
MGTTIRDVARAASVSIGTVSRALKNQPGLSEATRTRVIEVAQQLGYDSAQLRTRIRRVTFLLHRQHNNFAVSPFFSHVLNGFEEACRERRLVPSVLTRSKCGCTRPTRSRSPASSSRNCSCTCIRSTGRRCSSTCARPAFVQ